MKKFRIVMALLLVAALCLSSYLFVPKSVSAAEGISIKASTLKKAKPTLPLIVNGQEIPNVKVMKVSGKYDGAKTTYAYVPLQVFCENLGIPYTQKKKNVTIKIPDGCTVKFKVGKGTYTFTSPVEGKSSYMLGKPVTKDGILYVPAELFVTIGVHIGADISYDVTKKAVNVYVYQNAPITTGGWQPAESPVITKELQGLFDKALEGYVGANIEPVALFATQVVAGTNYGVLCRVTPVVPDATTNYMLVTLYADLQGNAEIIKVEDTGVASQINNLPDGWSQPPTVALTDEYLGYFNQAMEGYDGVSYEPVAIIEYQMTSGLNVCIFCKCQTVTPNAPIGSAFIYASVNILKKTAEITDIQTYYTPE